MEEFRDVVGLEDLFSISSSGRLFSKRSNKLLKLNNMNGYLAHVTKIGGRKGRTVVLKIHQLVARAFIPNLENKPFVNHIDGDRLNNSVDNLEWCTPKENSQHAFATGLSVAKVGEQQTQAKLTNERVNYCRENYIPRNREFGCRGLAKKFGVSHQLISDVISNKGWSHV